MTKLTTALAAVVFAAVITTAARPAAACGPYTPEGIIEWRASMMFAAHAQSDAELSRRFPALDAGSLARLRIPKTARAQTRWTRIDGKTALALVEITGGAAARYVEVRFAGDKGAWSWQPTSVKPASRNRIAVFKFLTTVSATLARR